MDRLAARHADAELIIDRSAVADYARLIEQEDLRRADRPEPVGNFVPQVLEDGEFDLRRANVVSDLGQRVLLIRVNADELDLFAVILLGELRQLRPVKTGERTVGAEKDDDDGLLVLPIVEGASRSQHVFEGERLDPFCERRIATRTVCRCR